MERERESELVRLCIEAACQSGESVQKWRRQRRSLERLPAHLADSLLRHLIRRRLIFPSLLEVFKHNAEAIELRGENSVDAEWMAYLGAFRYLRSLNVADCRRVTSSALWALTGMTCLKELDLSRCLKVTDAGMKHLLSISTLEKLWLSETGLTADGIALLSSLQNLSVLDLSGLPVTDLVLRSLQVLTKLEYLDLWGSQVSNRGAAVLKMFPRLSFLNLAWTGVTKLPNISSLECLNLSNCTIDSILEGNGNKAPLAKISLASTTFINEREAFLYIETSLLSFLDVSNSSLSRFCFLTQMKALEHLDLSSSMIGDDSVEMVACVGANLRNLNLSNTRFSSAGVGILAGHLPNLEILSLSGTQIDDYAISYMSMMPSLKFIDISNTDIKGFIQQVGAETDLVLSLTALQNLNHLERLNLEQTQVSDATLFPLSTFKELIHLSLRNASLTDVSLHQLSSLSKLTNLSIRDAVLTNSGLGSFKPPRSLKLLDLHGGWLLTEDAILQFCKMHPRIEVWHELSVICPSDQIGSNGPSPSRTSLRASLVKQKQDPMPMSHSFLDQRLKYSREELLELQYSSLSLARPDDSSTQDAMGLR
ncbi:hypothetical protein KPL70_005715 [Citrus sinensis]|uniref:Uncharacterized protein n=1 Tax=Citrus clementina TaxID=85681 RepID=V4TLQ8_CITCL|nr:chaoptin [Citrus x clementina]XP_006476390.2 receptor-like protein 53 [Citrus sinensis]ESR52595.1 hypothetical protein CICLE_v10019283mg [Citrus x clementina]KAH9719182.1 hypothetical protein KPL70_005715 [Citrus sinensis]